MAIYWGPGTPIQPWGGAPQCGPPRQGQLLTYADYGDYGVLGDTEIHENKVEQTCSSETSEVERSRPRVTRWGYGGNTLSHLNRVLEVQRPTQVNV